jgi:hypothetical protein
MTDEELARRRQQANDPVFLNEGARRNGITAKQYQALILDLCNQLEPMTEQERDERVANVRILKYYMLDQPPGDV